MIEYAKYSNGDLSAISTAKKELTNIIHLSKLLKEELALEYDQYKNIKAAEKEMKEQHKLEKKKTKELRKNYFIDS